MGAGRRLTFFTLVAATLISCAAPIGGPLGDGVGKIRVKIEGIGFILFNDSAINNGITFREGRYIGCADGTIRDLGANASDTGLIEPPPEEVISRYDAEVACKYTQQGIDGI